MCDLRKGTKRDAILFSAGANATHGLRRSTDDKRQAVLTLLEDEEWGKWSDREIARQCNVTHPFVAKIRADLTPPVPDPKPDSHLETFPDEAPATRTVKRGEQVYPQKAQKAAPAPAQPEKPAKGTKKAAPEPEPEAEDNLATALRPRKTRSSRPRN